MRRARGRGRGLSLLWAAVVLALPGPTGGLAAQDVEAVARLRGIPLPRGYYERIAADPKAFTLPDGLFRTSAEGVVMPAAGTSGTRRLAVVPALFSDSPEPHVSAQDIQRAIFDGPAPRGTLTEAYLEMSRGALTVTGETSPWVRTSLTLAEVVGESSGLGADSRVGEYLLEALAFVDPGIDFGLYDNDGPDGVPNSPDDNGVVDAIAFEFIEIAASCGGPGVWPHLWGIMPQNDGQPFFTDDLRPDGTPVTINAYIIQSAVDCGGVEIQDASTIAHEFGHVLGLPDYYHPTDGVGAEGRRWVLGCWELMAAGSWGCGPVGSSREPYGPAHMSARSKHSLDWLSYVTIPPDARDLELEMDPVQVSGEALRIALDDVGREFLLVEYRSRTGFDAQLPAEGLMVYHQDFEGQFRPDPASTTPYFLTVVEQDANGGLLRTSYEGGNRGEGGDAWGVGGVVQKLHAQTVPGTLRHDGTASSVTFHEMVVDGGKARIRISTARTPAIVAPADPLRVSLGPAFERRLRIAGGFMPYEVTGTLPDGVSASTEGDELILAGTLEAPGPFELALRVLDDRGQASADLFVPMAADEWLPGEATLVQPFLGSDAAPLTPAERAYLDYLGNGNGRYDVGDLRTWLRAAG